MKTKEQIKELNNRIDVEYQKYRENFTKLMSEHTKTVQDCNGWLSLIDSERYSMRDEIEALYSFLIKFGALKEKVTVFDFKIEERVKLLVEQPRTRLDKISANEAQWYEGLLGRLIVHNKNKVKILCAEDIIGIEETEQKNHLDKICDGIQMNKLIYEIINAYRISITTVKDAVAKIQPNFCLVEAFLQADSMAADIINDDYPQIIPVGKYEIERYENTPYGNFYLFVRNIFDYYQFITKVFKESILGKIIEDSIVTDEERAMFESQLSEVKTRSMQLLDMVEMEK